ncbi:MAG: peptidoglycan-binding domain-containing protein [Candidatus Paceibacterota bacterium]
MKKIIVSLLVCAIFLTFVPSVKAYTMNDLYAQIQSLQKQVANLQSELYSLALRAATSVTSVSRTATTTQNVNVSTASINNATTSVNTTPATTTTVVKNIESGVATKEPAIKTAITSTGAAINTVASIGALSIGSSGKDVISLQQKLKNLGLLKGNVDGKYGKITSAAVSQFQKANNLTPTGVADKSTMDLIIIGPIIPSDVIFCRRSAPPSITVLSPNGGEVYTAGQQITVKWTSCNIPAGNMMPIGLSIYDSSNNQTLGVTLTDNSSLNDGQEVVTLPTLASLGNLSQYLVFGLHYKISVWDSVTSTVDYSNNLFTINAPVTPCLPTTPPWINVISPNGGEVYTAGQHITITWTSCNIPAGDFVKANLVFNGVPNNAGYSAVPGVYNSMNYLFPDNSLFTSGSLQSGLFYKIELTSINFSTGAQHAQDLSNNLFTINAQQ